MKRILLVCSAGMSTSLLVTKMQKAAEEMGVEAKIWAVGDSEAKNNWQDADVLLLGPQVRFLKAKMEEMVNGAIPVDVIDMVAYGSMNGKKVIEAALALIGE